jgi:hypothetical protein
LYFLLAFWKKVCYIIKTITNAEGVTYATIKNNY